MTCSNCGKEVDADAKFCPHCGQNLKEAPSQSGGNTCAECGAELKPGAKFCAACGSPVVDIDPEAVYQADWKDIDLGKPDARSSRSRMVTLLPMLLLPVLVLIFYFLSRQNKPAPEAMGGNPANNPANMAQMQGVFQQIDSLRAALKANPQDTSAMLILGQMYEIASRFDEAKKYYTQYLDINPDNIDVQMRVANIYFNQKDFTKAESTLKKVLAKQPKNAYALYNYALTLHLLGNIDGAIAHWEKAIAIDPNGEIGRQAKQAIETVRAMRSQKN